MRKFYTENQLDRELKLKIKDLVKRVEYLSEKLEPELPEALKEQFLDIKYENNEKIIANRIVLKFRRGKKLEQYHKCSQCYIIKRPIYVYSKSNIGVVYLCGVCKDEVFNRSFGSIGPKVENLIGKAIKSGGGWETNRRKH